MGRTKDFSGDILAAHKRLLDLVRQRDQLNVQIIQLQNQIRALTAVQALDTLSTDKPDTLVGLTDAIRSVMRLAKKPMTAAEVKLHLDLIGFDFGGLANPSSAVHNTLKRMVTQRELYSDEGRYRVPDPFYGE